MAYADSEELIRILKLRNVTDAQQEALDRVLDTAAGEIDAELDRASTDPALSGWELALVAEVNIERAVEHWRQQESPFGLLGLGTDFAAGAERTAQDSWNRHANKLAPLKTQWGLA